MCADSPKFGMAMPINGVNDYEECAPPAPGMLLNVNGRSDFKRLSAVKHDAYCDFCKKNVDGIRYKCVTLPDFDICELCYPPNRTDKSATNYLDPQHIFYAIDYHTVDDYRGPLGNRTNIVHKGFKCYICDDNKDIIGTRYTCVQCQINLCEVCEFNQKHNPLHVRMKIVTPPEEESNPKGKVGNVMPMNGRQDYKPFSDTVDSNPRPLMRMAMPMNGRQDFASLNKNSNINGGLVAPDSKVVSKDISRNSASLT